MESIPCGQIAGVNKRNRDTLLQVSRQPCGVPRDVIEDTITRWLPPPESAEKKERRGGDTESSIDKRSVPTGRRWRTY